MPRPRAKSGLLAEGASRLKLDVDLADDIRSEALLSGLSISGYLRRCVTLYSGGRTKKRRPKMLEEEAEVVLANSKPEPLQGLALADKKQRDLEMALQVLWSYEGGQKGAEQIHILREIYITAHGFDADNAMKLVERWTRQYMTRVVPGEMGTPAAMAVQLHKFVGTSIEEPEWHLTEEEMKP